MKLIKLWWHCLIGTIKLGDHRMCQYTQYIRSENGKPKRIYNAHYCTCGYMKTPELEQKLNLWRGEARVVR